MAEQTGNEKGPEEQKKEPDSSPSIDTLNAEFLKDLKENPRYVPFFEQYETQSVKHFIEHYARHKAMLLTYGNLYVKGYQKRISQYAEMAEEKLWEIQQRKLFDLQCRWRANQVKVPEINTTADFIFYEKNIRQCTFLTPISQEEFDRYLNFVKSSSYEDIFFEDCADWQDYEELKDYYIYGPESDEYMEEILPWYEYYESVTGLSELYLLPDLRGEKEKFYRKLYFDTKTKESKQQKKEEPWKEPDKRPTIGFADNEFIAHFIEKFENHILLLYHKAYVNEQELEDDGDLENAIETLKTADRIVTLKEDTDWRSALISAANDYVKTRLIEELPIAYKNYLFRIELKLGFHTENDNYDDWYETYKKYSNEAVLGGRELNGEPRDFNF